MFPNRFAASGQGRAYWLSWGLVAGVLLVPACSQPLRDGPRLREVPEGFMYDANASQARTLLVDEEKAEEGAWFQLTVADEHSSIFITRYDFQISADEAVDAYHAYVDRYPADGYGELEEIEIDDRPAWGFSQEQWFDGELSALSYRAIIPYEEETFAVEFHSDIEKWLDPAAQREVVCQFEVPGERSASSGKMTALIGLALGGFIAWIIRRR